MEPTSLSLPNHVALITGGGRGIGAATAEALARKGARVIVASRTESELTATVARLRAAGLNAAYQVLDVADDAAVQTVFEGIAVEFGRLDILINNAAILLSGAFAELELADWDQLMAVNLRGAMPVSYTHLDVYKRQVRHTGHTLSNAAKALLNILQDPSMFEEIKNDFRTCATDISGSVQPIDP